MAERDGSATSIDADLRTIIAHPFLALAREWRWDDAQLATARKLIDVTVIRVQELMESATPVDAGATPPEGSQGESAHSLPSSSAPSLRALRELSAKWRKKYPAQTVHKQSADDYWAGQCCCANKCADELDAALGEKDGSVARGQPVTYSPAGSTAPTDTKGSEP